LLVLDVGEPAGARCVDGPGGGAGVPDRDVAVVASPIACGAGGDDVAVAVCGRQGAGVVDVTVEHRQMREHAADAAQIGRHLLAPAGLAGAPAVIEAAAWILCGWHGVLLSVLRLAAAVVVSPRHAPADALHGELMALIAAEAVALGGEADGDTRLWAYRLRGCAG